MSIHNIYFHGEIRKNIMCDTCLILSGAMIYEKIVLIAFGKKKGSCSLILAFFVSSIICSIDQFCK